MQVRQTAARQPYAQRVGTTCCSSPVCKVLTFDMLYRSRRNDLLKGVGISDAQDT